MDIADLGVISSTFLWVIFWLFVAAVVLVPKYLRSRERSKLLDTLKVAYEKGQPVPPELIDALQRGAIPETPAKQSSYSAPERDLRRAIVLICVGAGIALAGYGLYYGISFASDEGGAITGSIVAGVGAIPGLIGVAYLLLWLVRRPGQ
ncbi:MAG TPA: DUF6249 domain-containing protein [Caulobacteraceae bacterium]|jgi:hypothetical protein|nr:DUF6249 domain-containing protein [Caulobacteraceae bacterium]